MTHALVVHDLHVTAGRTACVRGVSFAVHDGERVALLGASGSGKSLTAAAVCGSLSPALRSTGRVTVPPRPEHAGRRGRGWGLGWAIGSARRSAPRSTRRSTRRDVALVGQDSLLALHPLVRVGPQLTRPLRARGSSPAQARRRGVELLAAMGLEDPERVLDGYAAELSGGQRQRVCVALAVACGSRLLVADEPTTALDVVSEARVLDALELVPAAQLFITHDLAVASRLCSRALVLDAGRLVEDAPMARLLDAPVHPASRRLVDAARARVAR